jgi:ABC-type transport system involved in multi-copper enzyme maturation permease subunit
MRAIFAIAYGIMKELVRKKDFYVLLIFMLVLMGLLVSQTFFQMEGITRYIKDFGYTLVMFFSFIIAVTFTAKQIPAEIESRTIYPLLAKPLSRRAVILGKYLGGSLVSIISFTIFFTVFAIFDITSGSGGNFLLLTQGFILGVLFLFLVTAIVVFFSNFMTTSANVTLSFLIYIIIGGFSDSIREAALFSKGIMAVVCSTIYYLVPHFDFFDMRVRITHAWDPLAGWVVLAVTAYTVIYCTALIYFSGVIFDRRRL